MMNIQVTQSDAQEEIEEIKSDLNDKLGPENSLIQLPNPQLNLEKVGYYHPRTNLILFMNKSFFTLNQMLLVNPIKKERVYLIQDI